jgi:hypothetical protein
MPELLQPVISFSWLSDVQVDPSVLLHEMIDTGILPAHYTLGALLLRPESTLSPSVEPDLEQAGEAAAPQSECPMSGDDSAWSPISQTQGNRRKFKARRHFIHQEKHANCSLDGMSPVDTIPAHRAHRKWACACCGTLPKASINGKLLQCSRCTLVRYCGKDCQKAHWPVHKSACKAWRVELCRQIE